MHSFVSRPRLVAALSCSALALAGLGLGSAFSGSQPGEPAQAPDAPHAAPSLDQMGRILVQGLHSVEGCFGVDVADFNSGKNTIVAWFENKVAVERWYNHPAHTRLMGAVGARPGDRTPRPGGPPTASSRSSAGSSWAPSRPWLPASQRAAWRSSSPPSGPWVWCG